MSEEPEDSRRPSWQKEKREVVRIKGERSSSEVRSQEGEGKGDKDEEVTRILVMSVVKGVAMNCQ